MTDKEKLNYLREIFEYDARCLCCNELIKCADDCTFEQDCPDAHAKMVFARDVLEKTK